MLNQVKGSEMTKEEMFCYQRTRLERHGGFAGANHGKRR